MAYLLHLTLHIIFYIFIWTYGGRHAGLAMPAEPSVQVIVTYEKKYLNLSV
jgi:hypothetical protein